MRCWLEDSWLVAIVEAVPADEVRRWWNVKDTELLDHIVETAPAVHLGAVATCVDVTCDCRIEPPSPARRVFELLVLRGTCPEEFTVDETDPYVMPLLDEELRTALLAAFEGRDDDVPVLAAGDAEKLAAFLDKHMGAHLLKTSRGEGREILIDHRQPS